jgi:hypothetical protein
MLAAEGFSVYGVDVRFDAVHAAVSLAAAEGLLVRGWCADLTATVLPASFFSFICASRYLQRDLFPALCAALVPGGVVVYETFTIRQRALGRGPTSPAHLLEPGELVTQFPGFDVLFAEEVNTPEALARVVAQRPAAQ